MKNSENQNFWTEERDEIIRSMFPQQKTAAEVAEVLGVSRNAVLGRAHRLNVKKRVMEKQNPSRKKKGKRLRLPRQSITSHRDWLIENEFHILMKDMKEAGMTWREVGDQLGVSYLTVQYWVNILGIRKSLDEPRIRFSDEDVNYIRTAWAAFAPVEDIADKLNRSYGTIRQKIMSLQHAGLLGARNHYGARVYKKYGKDLLQEGVDPEEVFKRVNEAKVEALVAAKAQAKNAKERRITLALEQMHKSIADGEDRNVAIFRCRAEGVTLERLGDEFNITRERIRQICDTVARELAVASYTSSQNGGTAKT